MKHVLIGGNGFVGRHLAPMLVDMGEDVVVTDVESSDLPHYTRCRFQRCDITRAQDIARLSLGPDTIVYNVSAKMLSPIVPRARRRAFFWPVNTDGVKLLLDRMVEAGATKLVQYTTDMVYGHAVTKPQTEDHPRAPLGAYGASKLATEDLCEAYRAKGLDITIFRPRLIIGPGRLGILAKLFRLIDLNLPVPMIGSGRNPYQFVSVFDCASAAVCAWKAGVPNEAFNLGSEDPPSVRELLADLIAEAESRSILLPTPAWLVKRALDALDLVNLPLMDPEQYLIADEHCVLDCSKAKRLIGFSPQHRDEDMLKAAYLEYRRGVHAGARASVSQAPASSRH
jgi:dTDP-glucose 4,6-dehydratase